MRYLLWSICAAVAAFCIQGVPAFVLATVSGDTLLPESRDLYFWFRFPWWIGPAAYGAVLALTIRRNTRSSDRAWQVIWPVLLSCAAYVLGISIGVLFENLFEYGLATAVRAAAQVPVIALVDFSFWMITLLGVLLSLAFRKQRTAVDSAQGN